MSDRPSNEAKIQKMLRRFLLNTEKQGDCLLWKGRSRDSTGRYGRVCLTYPGEGMPKSVQTSVSRAVYVLEHRLPDLLRNSEAGDVSHLCTNQLCINPRHLTLETRAANCQRRACHQGRNMACVCVPPCMHMQPKP